MDSHINTQRTLSIPRIMIAAPGSGHGKTTVMAGIVALLREQGMKVATFKAGPDYLDPTYHGEASGKTCINLDQWLMGRDGVRSAFARGVEGCDIALIEGVMGLYDGLDPTSNRGSSWELSSTLQCPVVLVVDASGMARSIAPLVRGFAEFDSQDDSNNGSNNGSQKSSHKGELVSKSSALVGVIANRIGSESHGKLLGRALGDVPHVKYLGGVRSVKQNIFCERHLGLVSLRQNPRKKEELALASQLVKDGVDLDGLVALAREAPAFEIPTLGGRIAGVISPRHVQSMEPKKCRIGVARDQAFDFYYEDNLELLRFFGAELVFFSPLNDSTLPKFGAERSGAFDLDGIYLGGGYPELYARELSQNRSMIEDIRAFGRQGGMIYGECGGFMYLCQTIETLSNPGMAPQLEAQGQSRDSGKSWEMVGLLPGRIVMHERLKAIGYVEVETQCLTPLGPAGLRFRGHQFRYSERYLDEKDPHQGGGDGTQGKNHGIKSNEPLTRLQDASDESFPYRIRRRRDQVSLGEGALFCNVLGSYVHAHWGSNPMVAQSFVAQCAASRAKQLGILVDDHQTLTCFQEMGETPIG